MGKNKNLDLFKDILPSIDMGFKELWDAVDDEGKSDIKKDLWNLNRYASNIKGNYEEQALAIFKVNAYYNKNYNVIQKEHPKLLWYLLCMSGNTGSKKYHPWIKLERKADGKSKSIRLLMKIYPDKKIDEVELIARISTKKEIIELAKQYGYDNPEV